MQGNFEITVEDRIVRIHATGEVSEELGNAIMSAAANAALAHRTDRYLFDFRDARLLESYQSLYERPNFAKSVGIAFHSRSAVLCTVPDEKLTFTEDVAVNRGIGVKVFTDAAAALDWLKS